MVEGFEAVKKLDSDETRKYKPALYQAQVSPFGIACAPRPPVRARPGNRL